MADPVVIHSLYGSLRKWCVRSDAVQPRYCKDKYGANRSNCCCIAGLYCKDPLRTACDDDNVRALEEVRGHLEKLVIVAANVMKRPSSQEALACFFRAFDIRIGQNQFSKYHLKGDPWVPSFCRQGLILLTRWVTKALRWNANVDFVPFESENAGFYFTWLDPRSTSPKCRYVCGRYKAARIRSDIFKCYVHLWQRLPSSFTERSFCLTRVLEAYKTVHPNTDFNVASLKPYAPPLRRFISECTILVADWAFVQKQSSLLFPVPGCAYVSNPPEVFISDLPYEGLHWLQALYDSFCKNTTVFSVFSDGTSCSSKTNLQEKTSGDMTEHLRRCEHRTTRHTVAIWPKHVRKDGLRGLVTTEEDEALFTNDWPFLVDLRAALLHLVGKAEEKARSSLNGHGSANIDRRSQTYVYNFSISACRFSTSQSTVGMAELSNNKNTTIGHDEGSKSGFVVICPLNKDGCWVALGQCKHFPNGCKSAAAKTDVADTAERSSVDSHDQTAGCVWLYIPHGRAAAIKSGTLCSYNICTACEGNPKAIFCFQPDVRKSNCSHGSVLTDSGISYSQDQIADAEVCPAWLNEYTRSFLRNALEL
jgi:hypothetical protein